MGLTKISFVFVFWFVTGTYNVCAQRMYYPNSYENINICADSKCLEIL